MSWLSRFVKSNLLVIPALWRPNVKAAKDKEGLLKVNRVRSITGVGIKRNKNAKIFIKILEILLLKIPITTGGKLIAIPVDKRLKIIVSNISFKKNKFKNIILKRDKKNMNILNLIKEFQMKSGFNGNLYGYCY